MEITSVRPLMPVLVNFKQESTLITERVFFVDYFTKIVYDENGGRVSQQTNDLVMSRINTSKKPQTTPVDAFQVMKKIEDKKNAK